MRFAVRAWRRAREAIRRRPRTTGLGRIWLLLATALAIVGAAGAGRGVLLLGCTLLLAAILSFALPVRNLSGVRIERFLPAHAYAGEDVTAGAQVTVSGRRTAFTVLLSDGTDGAYVRPGRAGVLRVAPDEPVVVRYTVRFRERGRREVSECEVSTRHPLGLFEYRVRMSVKSEILVLPRRGVFRRDPLPGVRFARRMTCGETSREKGQEEFGGLREYRPGDNLRLIAWKASARHSRLMVKELEDDLSKKVTLFLDTAVKPDAKARGGERALAERAISFAGELARLLSRRNWRVEVVARGPGLVRVSSGRAGRGLGEVEEALALIEAGPRGGVDDLLPAVGPEDLFRSLPILVLPSVDPERLRMALARMPGGRGPVMFRMDGPWERSVFRYREG
jgi:uncharacterized protein (DUF58 family)